MKKKGFQKGIKRKLLHHKTSVKTENQMGGCGPGGALQLLGIREWGRRAENRDEWR